MIETIKVINICYFVIAFFPKEYLTSTPLAVQACNAQLLTVVLTFGP
jgi:hypothetical protein